MEVAGQTNRNRTKERRGASRRQIKRTRDVANVLHVTAQRTADVAMSALERGAEGVVGRRSGASKGYASISEGIPFFDFLFVVSRLQTGVFPGYRHRTVAADDATPAQTVSNPQMPTC